VAFITNKLTIKQSEDIERLQKRALRFIVGDVIYKEARSMFELSTIADRREELMRRFFDQLKRPDSCLVHLMPVKRELLLINYL